MNILLGGVKVKITVRFKDKGNGTALDVLPAVHVGQVGGRMTERMNEHCQYTP